MKTVILAGGFGTRISEESHLKPKPMIELGDKPILWHIMKYYSSYGHNDFIICCGYRGYVIKEYFCNYYLHTSDITFHFAENNRMEVHQSHADPWRVTLVDTGLHTAPGGRLGRIARYIDGETFMLTYGDGLSDVNIDELIAVHRLSGCAATLTAIRPEGRFGSLDITPDGTVQRFVEKPSGDNAWINGGFMVMEPRVLNLIRDDSTDLPGDVLPSLAVSGELNSYRHDGFWMPMDTLRDKIKLEQFWNNGQAPWKRWE